MRPLVEVRKVERSGEVLFTVALAGPGGTSMLGLYRDLPAALHVAQRKAQEHGASVRVEGARFTVGIERLSAATGEPVTVADVTTVLAAEKIHYVPVLRTQDGTVVLRLMGSSDLPTALEEARAFAEQHSLSFDDNVSP